MGENSRKRAWNYGNGYENFINSKFGKLTVISYVGIFLGHRHYRCKCDCGNLVVVDATKIKVGHTRSCGCIRRGLPQPKLRKEKGIASMNRLISSYKGNAHNKHIPLDLSNKEMIDLFKGNCYYCGCPPSSIMQRRGYFGSFIYNGIDRLNNDEGYTISNCVSCCKECNFKKGSQNNTDFINWIKRVYQFQINYVGK